MSESAVRCSSKFLQIFNTETSATVVKPCIRVLFGFTMLYTHFCRNSLFLKRIWQMFHVEASQWHVTYDDINDIIPNVYSTISYWAREWKAKFHVTVKLRRGKRQ